MTHIENGKVLQRLTDDVTVQQPTAVLVDKWLARVPDTHRVPVPARLRQMVTELKDGAWKYTGDPIRFSADGELVDGRTRLTAFKESGVYPKVVVIVNVPAEALDQIDADMRSRNFSKILRDAGVKYGSVVASVCAQIHRDESDVKTHASITALTRIYYKYDDLAFWAAEGARLAPNVPGLTQSTAAFLGWKLSRAPQEEGETFDVFEFFRRLEDGDTEFLPIKRLLDDLAQYANQRNRTRSVPKGGRQYETVVRSILTWNAVRRGQSRAAAWTTKDYARGDYPVAI